MQANIRTMLVVLGGLLLAACGGGSGGGSIAPPPAPPPPPPPPAAPTVDVQRVFPNLSFSAPVSLVQAPGVSSRWFVVEQGGVVRVFDNDQAENMSSEFVNISANVSSGGERGLLGIAFHPSFPSTPEVYLSYTADSGGLVSRISRFSLDSVNPDLLDPASEEILLVIPQPFSNHNGGELAFGPFGDLYASFGDGGDGGDPQGNAQNTQNLLGTIIRIDIDGLSPYEIPAGNPFANADLCATGPNTTNPCPEIFAWGLRNPFRFSFDAATGNLWIGDVGQNAWEEVDRVDSTQMPMDRNFGWNVREGAHCFPPGTTGCSTNFLDPVTEYDLNSSQSVTGGYVYRGSAIADLVGNYVFADFVQGTIFSIAADAQPTTAPDVLLDTSLSISTFAQDTNGELYVVDYGGTIHQIVDAP